MATNIHSFAIVNPEARIGRNVEIGPYAIIGPHVEINNSTRVGAFVQIMGYTQVGKGCKIFSHAVVGSSPQDLKYKGEISYLTIGDNNVIREFVTINPGTDKDSKTFIGNNNLFMAYTHIAHNCRVGSDNVFANLATLAGYVEIGNNVVIGGSVAIHQFCRVGNFAIIGGCSKVVQDIPPFSLCDGHPAKVKGLNLVGLRRADFSKDKINILKKAFKLLFFKEHTIASAQNAVKKSLPSSPELKYLLKFVSTSRRGISR